MTISRIGMQTHVYVCIFLMSTYNHANIILCLYVRFTFKWNVVWCWCMDCILIMRGNKFADYRHDVYQVCMYIYIYIITVVLGLKSRVITFYPIILQTVDWKCTRGGMPGKSESTRAWRRKKENGCLWFSVHTILETHAKAFVGRLAKREVILIFSYFNLF
jgi:hypothetical protein